MPKHSTRSGRETFLLNYLTERFTYFNAREWALQIQQGRISVNGVVVQEDCPIHPKDELEIDLDETISREPEVNRDWKLLHEDESLFIVNKPPDIPIHPAGRYRRNTLLTILQEDYPSIAFHPCHRLDRETSGIVVFAKNERAGRIVSKQFQKKTIYKEYLVWVIGTFPVHRIAEGYLYPDAGSIIRKKIAFSETLPITQGTEEEGTSLLKKNFSDSYTEFKLLNTKNGISLVKAIPRTGRTHQIRATLFSLGYPVLGDKIYGMDESAFLEFIQSGWSESLLEKLGHNRQALHCSKMILTHPDSSLEFEINSPFPQDLLLFL